MDVIAPMEAHLAKDLPKDSGWQFEPKWDGFRCIAVRDGSDVTLWSRSGKPLGRYFPDIIQLIAGMNPQRFILDGELLIIRDGAVAFDALQLRLHPASSRVARLVGETPASFMVFDCLASGRTMLAADPLAERRAELEKLLAKEAHPNLILSLATTDRKVALGWLEQSGGALDGVIAKRLDQPYQAGERAMIKVKPKRTADCVVGGFRYGSGSREV